MALLINLIIKQQNQFEILRSHWNEGDLIWIANARRYRQKLLANFCYFAPAIRQNILILYPDDAKCQSIKIVIPRELLHQGSARLLTNFELSIQR